MNAYQHRKCSDRHTGRVSYDLSLALPATAKRGTNYKFVIEERGEAASLKSRRTFIVKFGFARTALSLLAMRVEARDAPIPSC